MTEQPKMTLPNGVVLRPADEMDLTALCKPFGMLHADTQAAMEAWPHGVFWFEGSSWLEVSNGFATCSTYRAKPAPAPIRATIPWEFLVPELQWVAQNEDGEWFGYQEHGSAGKETWTGASLYDLFAITFPQGNEHWTNTLQQRPQTGDKQGGGNV